MTAPDDMVGKLAPWFHNIHLPDGTQTCPDHPLGDFPGFKWEEIHGHIPERLDGWSVLDVGCNAGFYSIELAKRGARVTGIDIDEHYLEQARWASAQFDVQERIGFRNMDIYDIAHEDRQYDLIWYMGVFYHLRYPYLSLDIVSRCVKKLLVFQTMTIPDREQYEDHDDLDLTDRDKLLLPGWPRMAFVEHSLAGDPTNWWVPNSSAVLAMLRSVGFRVLSRPSHEVYLCEPSGERLPVEDYREQEYRAAIHQKQRNG